MTPEQSTTPQLRPGSERCMCGVCGQFFSTTANFDRHRIGSYEEGRRCLSPREIAAKKGLVCVNGVWQRPGNPNLQRMTQETMLEGDA